MNSDVDTEIKDGDWNDPSSHPVKYVAQLCALLILGLVVLVGLSGYVEKKPEAVKASGSEARK